MIVTQCCLCTMVPKAAWLLVVSWMFLSRRPKRASVPGNASRTWTVGPQRTRAPTRTWALSTRTVSGQEKTREHECWCMDMREGLVTKPLMRAYQWFSFLNIAVKTIKQLTVCYYSAFHLSQTTFQWDLSAGRRKKPVHQVLHHWYGWRDEHLGCQGNIKTQKHM